MNVRERAPFEAVLVRRRHNRLLVVVSRAPVLAGAIAIALCLLKGAPGVGLATSVLAGWLLLRRWIVRQNPVPWLVDVAVHASAEGLRLDGDVVPRADLRDGLVVPLDSGGVIVRTRRRRGMPIELSVADRAEGRRLLRALGLDASQSVARFRALSRAWANTWTFAAMVVLPIVLIALGGAPGPIASLAAWSLLALVALVPTRVEVGADGVLVTWMGLSRFAAAADIVDAKVYTSWNGRRAVYGTAITLLTGEVVSIAMGRSRTGEDDATVLTERITEVVDVVRRGLDDDTALVLARGGRPVPDWIRALRRIGSGADATLRTAPIDPERLWRVVESSVARAADRAAAAIALGLEPEAAARLRVTADAVVEPRLRVVLAAAAGKDEAALEAALGLVAGEPPADDKTRGEA